MRLLLISAAMAAFSTAAAASEWWLVAITSDQGAVFVDRQSVVDASSPTRRVTAASAMRVDPKPGGPPTISRFTAFFECNGRYSGEGSSTFNRPEGAGPSEPPRAQTDARFAPAVRGTGQPQVILFGCNEKRIIEGEAQYSINGSDFFRVDDPVSDAGAYLTSSSKRD